MDISISRLNNRMAVQVPTELPLGLVFITGRVEKLSLPSGTDQQVAFYLVDDQHRLACRVPMQVVEETQVEEGNRIRASGRLRFDPRYVHYCLYARDLEVLSQSPAIPPSPQIMSPTLKQRAEAASLVQGEFPPWVKKLAPPEVQKELGLLTEFEEEELEELHEEVVEAAPEPVSDTTELEEARRELPPEMLAFLSDAIDSAEDIELTREMISEYLPREEKARRPTGDSRGRQRLGEEIYEESVGASRRQSTELPAGPSLLEGSLSADSESQEGSTGSQAQRWALTLIFILMLLTLFLLTLFLWDLVQVGDMGLLLPAGFNA